ncbi:MAG: C10 family peptidase [Muribaculaceae bacterium]|nr:C10 family peptidase [Muribaculaceae bacterium]
MKKTIITLAAAALAATGVSQASPLSPAQALGRAMSSADAPASMSRMLVPGRVEAALTLNVLESEEPALYVISRGEGQGFVVVSADDVAEPLLGYSDTDLDLNNLPDNFRWWLSQYQAEISAGIAAGASEYGYAAAASRKDIEPLVTTKWDQGAPYNLLCPTSGNQSTYAGCVAVAMAQVIKYHDYPEKGTGSHSYSWNGQRLTFDYANTTFEWDLMLNSYSSTSGTAAERNAVATLIYACGVAVDMGYGTSSSGAQSSAVPGAMREYFGFDKGINMAVRLAYSSEEWEDLIYNDLKNVGPVYYSGRGESGGHAFVCDGYKNGLFHFNWGWGGMSDGYFRLNRLVPGSQGIGGNSDGFNSDQTIILGAEKPIINSTLPAPYIMCSQPLTASVSGTNAVIPGPFISYTPYTLTGRLSMRIYDMETGEYIRAFNAGSTTWTAGSGYRNLSFGVGVLPVGRYRGELTFLYNNEYYPIHHTPVDTGSFEIVRAGSTFTITPIVSGNIQWGELEVVSPMYTDKLFGLSLPYTYDGEKDVYFQMTPQLQNAAGAVVAKAEMYNAIVSPGQGVVDYSGKWLTTVNPGDYTLVMVDGNGKSLGSANVTVSKYTGGVATFISVSSSAWNIDETTADNIVINAKATCSMGYFAGTIAARIYDKGNTATPLAQLDSRPLYINKGETKDVTISGPFYEGVEGKTYDVYIYNGIQKLSGPKEFTLGASTAIEGVIIENDAPIEYFNLQGQPVSNPTAGSIVIRRQGEKVDKILMK